MSDDKPKDVTVGLGGLAAMSMTMGSVTLSTSVSGAMIFTSAARQLAASARTLDTLDHAPTAGLDRSAFDQLAGELMAASLGATLMAYLSIESAMNELMLAHSLGYVRNCHRSA